MKILKLVIAVGVLVMGMGVAMLLRTEEAGADHTRYHCSDFAWHPSDNSWTCESNLQWYKACDYHVDGHRVRGWIDVTFSADDRATAWAPSQGCTEPASTAYGGGLIDRIKTCTESEGCSGWVDVH